MFKFNFNKSNTSTIIPSYTISKRTIDYIPINKKSTPHDLNINDLTDIVVELDNEIENLKIIKTKIEEILSNKRKTEIKKDDINKIYDNCLSVEQTIDNKENNPIEILTKQIKEDKENVPMQKNTENEQNDSKDIQKDNENNEIVNEIVDNVKDQIDIGKNIDKINI